VSLEEQLRKDAESMREMGWFNRAKMYTAAADEIHRLNKRIKLLEETLEAVTDKLDDAWGIYMEFKEPKP